MNLIESIERRPALVAAILGAGLYALTLAPTISHTDSGELVAVCHSFGVAHPTGYPLYTVLGGLFSRIPLGSPAFALNVMAMLLCAGGVYFWGRALALVFAAWKTKASDAEAQLRVRWAQWAAVLGGALIAATGQTWWAQSTSAEVYSLHAFLLGLNLWLLLRAHEAPEGQAKPWLLLAGGLALAFANHLSITVLLPGIAWLFFRRQGLGKSAFKLLAMMLAVFFPLLILQYAWLPLRAASGVPFAWGNPQSWEAIWHHVSGAQFRVWMFTGMEAFQGNLGAYFQRLPWEMGVGLLLLVPGLRYAFAFRRDLAVFFALNVAANLLWACNYAIKDLEPYFLLSLLSLGFFAAAGLRWAWLRLNTSMLVRKAISAAVLAAVLALAAFNYLHVDQRHAFQYHDYAKATMESMPPNSILLSRAWDVIVSPSYYLQQVEGLRPDIDVIDYHMLHDRHWYPDHMRRNMPELTATIAPRLEAWERTVRDFDLRGKMDVQRLSTDFTAVYQGIVGQVAQRPFYLSPDMKDMVLNPANGLGLPPGYTLVPEQYLYRILPVAEAQQYRESPLPNLVLRTPRTFGVPEDLTLLTQLRDVVGTRILYERQFQKQDRVAALENYLAGLPALDAQTGRP